MVPVGRQMYKKACRRVNMLLTCFIYPLNVNVKLALQFHETKFYIP